MAEDSAAERIRSGATWEQFCDTLKGAGSIITGSSSPDDPFDRAEGFRYLTRILRAALETLVENADPLRPVFHRPVHETAKMGADNPDIRYEIATVSGEREYVIRGHRNTVHYLGLGTFAGNYGAGGRMGKTGYVEGADLAVAADGRFEIAVSRERKPGNWLELAPDSTFVIVRQMFLDRAAEQPAELTIECVGGATARLRSRPRPSTAGSPPWRTWCSAVPRSSRAGPTASASTPTSPALRPQHPRAPQAATPTSPTTTRTGSSRPTRRW
ncbi:MAG: hypothetical protein IPK07_10125 [Deltaproteobacteria bacterium]|nr:hypothetical protein [Deltaproteobacteria bacterium]